MNETVHNIARIFSPMPCLPVVVWAVLAWSIPSQGQFYEDFADSNFTVNPAWVGETGKFIVNSRRELQLNAPAVSGSALLRTPSVAVHQGCWEFHGSMAFNPSSVNLLDLYLMATDTAPNLSGQGYLVRLGGTNDNIEFHRSQNGSTTRLGSWGNGWLNKEINNFAIKVERYANGIWYCYADTNASGAGPASWIWLGSVTDNTITRSSYVVLRPVYTSTRSKLFSFRKISVIGTIMPDSVAPYVLNYQFVTESKLSILFSEPIDTLHAALALVMQHPAGLTCTRHRWRNDTMLDIDYSGPFPLEQRLALGLRGLQDHSGLPLDTILEVLRNQYRAGRVRISEFMSDPDPPMKPTPDGLPLSEFVEIHNPDSLPLQLQGCSLGDASTIAAIPPSALPPQAYALLVPFDQKDLWQQWSALQTPFIPRNIIGVQPWPSLNNDEDLIRILGPGGNTLDSLTYQITWWRTPQQKQGGWSMTKQNLLCPCQDSLNWMPSTHPLGGDPGTGSPHDDSAAGCRNLGSVMASQILVDPNNGVRIQFATPVRPTLATFLVLLIDGDSLPIQVNLADSQRLLSEWLVMTGLAWSLKPGQVYTMLCEGWESCNGALTPKQFLPVGLGIAADSAQVVISEIYPRPLHTDYPWVECCNLSGQVLDRSRVWLFRTGPEGEVLEGNALGQDQEPWFPGQCLLLSRNRDFVKLEGLTPCTGRYWVNKDSGAHSFDTLALPAPCLSLPALPKTAAFLSLQDHQSRTLDRVAYHDSCLHPWAGNLEGRSLQRWAYDRPYTGNRIPPTRWISSSSQQRATPGCFTAVSNPVSGNPFPSSKRRRDIPVALTLSNQVIVPNALVWIRIGLQFQDQSMSRQARVNLRIMDLFGRTITHLCQDEWADENSAWSWDGRMGQASNRLQGMMVPDGAYPVYLEWQNAEGQTGWDLTEIYVLRTD